MEDETVLIWGQLWKERICSYRSKFFPSRVASYRKGRQNEIDRVASPLMYPSTLNYAAGISNTLPQLVGRPQRGPGSGSSESSAPGEANEETDVRSGPRRRGPHRNGPDNDDGADTDETVSDDASRKKREAEADEAETETETEQTWGRRRGPRPGSGNENKPERPEGSPQRTGERPGAPEDRPENTERNGDGTEGRPDGRGGQGRSQGRGGRGRSQGRGGQGRRGNGQAGDSQDA